MPTVYFEIEADSALLVQMEDGTYRVAAQMSTPDAAAIQNNSLVAFVEGFGNWSEVHPRWKTASGEPRVQYFGHDVRKSVAS